MKTTSLKAEAFAYPMMLPSILDTQREVGCQALATTSSYPVMVRSQWGRTTEKMERNVEEEQFIRLMELRRSLADD